MERFSLKNINEVEGKEQYCVEVSNKSAPSENLDAEVDSNGAQETVHIIYHLLIFHKSSTEQGCGISHIYLGY
jgi:hypothetical protein